MNTQLIHFDVAKRELALATSIDEVKKIRDQAEAIRQYIRQQKGSFEMQNQAAEIKLRAERRAGEMLAKTELNKGGRPTENPLHDVSSLPKLADLGISEVQSHRWQLEAEIPEEKFEQFIAETKVKAEELTSRATLGIALKLRHEQKKQTVGELATPKGLFSVIAIDPPWQYGGSYNPYSHRVESPYPEMSIEELMMLDIPAANDCIVWLWVTNAFMHDAYHILEAWAFEPKTILTWFKDKTGVGYWLRGETEHCLLAVKGHPIIDHSAQSTHLKVKATSHSSKPDEFYELVESLCGKATETTHLEMFARKQRPNWAVWGNEVNNATL